MDNLLQRFLLPAKLLRVFRVIPYRRVFQFGVYLFQLVRLLLEVKDTSAGRLRAR
jgi:hypothetical protein